MPTAVCDTSTLIMLTKGKVLHCLGQLFERIYLPAAVQAECHNPEILEAIAADPFKVYPVEYILPLGMGAGEREAISLALELNVKILITDDKKAFRKAHKKGLTPLRMLQTRVLQGKPGITGEK